MKTKIALFTALIMVFTVVMPSIVFAAGDPGLENAIKSAKQKFDIPQDYNNFTYSVVTNGDSKVWELNWSSKDAKGSNIQISVDNTGDVQNYTNYKYMDYENVKKLPGISKANAKIKAEETIKKLSPDIWDSLKIIENNQRVSISDNAYSFNYVRTYNGIPFPQNGVSVNINKQTGELLSYSKNWSKDITFPSNEKALSLKEAQEAYIKNLGLRLTYNSSSDKDGIKVFGVYSPEYSSEYCIDALTGEKLYLGRIYYDTAFSEASKSMEKAMGGDSGSVIVLTPEEIKAVDEVSKLLSQEEAEKIARDLKILELDDTFKLESASLYKDWSDIKSYQWNLHFSKSVKEDYIGVRVRINATSGEITSFNTGYSKTEDSTPKYDEDAAKKSVEEFLSKLQPAKFKETKYEEKTEPVIKVDKNEAPAFFNFQYTRMVNGIPFPYNNITVEFNAITGKITNYNLMWNDLEFPSLDNAAPIDKIYDIFFKDIGLELQYTTGISDIVYEKRMGQEQNTKKEVKLVYTVKSDKPAMFDALTGVILGNDGKPYKEEKPLEYTDIKGHYAQDEIELLAQAGIGLEGPELKPEEKIKQKDFLLLISQVISNGYNFYGKKALVNDSETEDLYKLLIQEGIVKEGEKAPEAPLTREDSVKFVIRALKYEKVAALSNIFNCTFKDKNEINPELIGHVVIAKGLNIVSGHGDYFRPKTELKKADALIIIYNYLKI